MAEAADRMGVVSRGDLPRLFRRHLAEALAPALVKAIPPGARVLDIGSGGGLPGIPLALVRPDVYVTLMEARGKKIAFLERVLLTLNLTNAMVYGRPLEALADIAPAPFDVGVARGLTWTSPMIAALERCVKADGVLIRFGGPGAVPAGVRVELLEGATPRALQFWPRATWAELGSAP